MLLYEIFFNKCKKNIVIACVTKIKTINGNYLQFVLQNSLL